MRKTTVKINNTIIDVKQEMHDLELSFNELMDSSLHEFERQFALKSMMKAAANLSEFIARIDYIVDELGNKLRIRSIKSNASSKALRSALEQSELYFDALSALGILKDKRFIRAVLKLGNK